MAQIAEIIKYEGDNSTFIWKHPCEDFNSLTQLIVHESQEALFFRDGKALDLFGAGRYTLATQNLPALEKLYKLPTNTDEVFHSEVYFINMTTQMGIKWGTDSKVRLFDPASGLHIEIGASGEFNLRVINSRKFLLKVVGTADSFIQAEIAEGPSSAKQYGVKSAVAHFKSLILTKVKAFLARAIKENDINILEIDAHLDEISDYLRIQINEVLDEYGLFMPEFFVTTIVTPDNNPDFDRLKKQFAEKTLLIRNEEIKKAEAQAAQGRKILETETQAKIDILKQQAEAQKEIITAQGNAEAIKIKGQAEAEAYKAQAFAEAEEMKAKGYSYQQETARMVGLEAMQNGITGGTAGGGLGDIASLGVTLGAMGGVIGMTKEAINPIIDSAKNVGSGFGDVVGSAVSDTSWSCACGAAGITSKFCPECGAKKPEPKQADTWDCSCGMKGITSKFCPECGAKKPEPKQADTWDCAQCGCKGITSKFCPDCGAKKPETPETWDCPDCGCKGITSKFCPECGRAKE